MDHSLNELFSVILHSEKVAMDEKKKCLEVKVKIETVRNRLEKQAETKRECAEKIEKLTDGLFQSMLGAKFIKSKEEFLATKLQLIQTEITSDAEKLENLNAHYENSSKTFMSLVHNFSHNYGIISNGRETRESEARADIKRSRTKVDTLSHDLQNLQARNKELSDAVSNLQETKRLKKVMENQRKEYESQIEIEEREIMQLQAQRLQLETLPDTDESFTSLNKELQHYETVELEKTARELQSELNQLLGAVKQKEGQKLRQQFRQWQRQRQQMLRQEKRKQDDGNQPLSDKSSASTKVTGKRFCADGKCTAEDKEITKSSQEITSLVPTQLLQ